MEREMPWNDRCVPNDALVGRPQEGVELESNILRAPAKPAGGCRCKFCTLKI
jgi:hypothetical protein